MDTYTFLSELVKALSWPFVVIVIFIILRKPLAGLIPLLQRLKLRDLELEFAQKVERVRAEVRFELAIGRPPTALPAEAQDRIRKLSEVSPRSAVLEAWRELEVRLIEAANIVPEFRDSRRKSSLDAIRVLEKSEGFSPEVSTAIQDLRSLRNRAAHAPDFALSSESAQEYLGATDEVAAVIQILTKSA